MRDIKFRAWDAIEKKMWNPIVKPDGELMSSNGIGGYVTHYQMPRDPLMQYTGLLDKNGVEIFTGDIMKWNPVEWGGEFSEVVTWDYELFNARRLDWKEWCEVVGNIYANPELTP